MNLSVKLRPAQPETNQSSLVESATNHIQAAARITDIDDLRYFNMRDLQDVRINLHLALELLSVISKGNQR